MNKLITTDITSTALMPVKSGTWDFLQNANKEGFAAVVQALIGDAYDPTVVYRLYGAVITPTGGDIFSNTEGAVYYDGEIYLVDAAAGISIPDNITIELITTNYTDGTKADPVTFTNGIGYNIHNIRRFRYGNSVSTGRVIVDFNIGVGWVDISTFSGSFVSLASTNTASYSKNSVSGVVHLKGGVGYSSGTSSAPATVATLPVGYRPTQRWRGVCWGTVSGVDDFYPIEVDTAGQIIIRKALASGDVFYLSQISFPTW